MREAVAALLRLSAVALLSVGLWGCGGSFGVENATLVGRVYGNASGGSVVKTPLSGVRVLAVSQSGDVPIMRTAVTNVNGEYVLPNLPPGEYALGFSKDGFRTINVEEGNTRDQTALGEQIKVAVDSGTTLMVPDVTMQALAQEGDCTLVLTILDLYTGEPVTHATVISGSAVASNGGANGVYTLSVPVQVNDPEANFGTQPEPISITISADGYVPMTVTDIIPVANETVQYTVSLQPRMAYVTGRIVISKFDTLYTKSSISISCDSVSLQQGGGDDSPSYSIEDSGRFRVVLPASNVARTRQFNLSFFAPNLQVSVVSNIVMPRAGGTRELTSPVVLNPITVDLVGTVADSNGNPPNQLNPSGLPDTVTVVETGQVANIVNGTYTIPDVPTTDGTVGPAQLTIEARAYNPLGGGGVGAVEQGNIQVQPTSDGSANPTFTVPLIRLN